MGKQSPLASEPHEVSNPSDNLEMIADMFTAMKATGKDPDMPIKEIADIGQQLIDMIRQKDREIRELRQMHENLMAEAMQQSLQREVRWGGDGATDSLWRVGGGS